jgi:hypothetical protein
MDSITLYRTENQVFLHRLSPNEFVQQSQADTSLFENYQCSLPDPAINRLNIGDRKCAAEFGKS